MTDQGRMTVRDEMEVLLPFYLNGTLDGADREAVEQWLATDPDAAAALEHAEAEFSGTLASNEAIVPPADAFGRFSRALDELAGPAAAPASRSHAAGLWQRFLAIPASVAWAAAAAAIMLLIVQTVTAPDGSGNDFQIAGGSNEAAMPFALVTFRPDAAIGEIADFLGGNGAEVISGPGPGAVFRIGITAATAAEYDRIVGLIAAQPFAETVVAGRRPGNG